MINGLLRSQHDEIFLRRDAGIAKPLEPQAFSLQRPEWDIGSDGQRC